jgi:hypothetical protein
LRSGWTVAPIALLQLAAFPDGLLNHRCQMPLRAMPLSVRFQTEKSGLATVALTFAVNLNARARDLS